MLQIRFLFLLNGSGISCEEREEKRQRCSCLRIMIMPFSEVQKNTSAEKIDFITRMVLVQGSMYT